MAARYRQLAELVNERGWKRGAELGVFSGRTHNHLLANCPGLELIGVDVWDWFPGFKESPTKSGEKCRCQYCNETRADRAAETPEQMRVRMVGAPKMPERGRPYCGLLREGRSCIMVMPTFLAAQNVDRNSLDFVFIDGDHSTEGVALDIREWLPKIRLGGMLLGHDWNMQSVRAAVLSSASLEGRIGYADEGDDHLWWASC